MPQPKDWAAHENAARLEDLQFMADTGETLTGAAHRLGLSTNTLHKWCSRHQALHLYNQLANRDPLHHPNQKEHTAA